jgi:site-specific DNA recombinase
MTNHINYEQAVGYFRLSRKEQALTNAFSAHLTRLILAGLEEDQIYYDIDAGSKLDREGYQKVLQMVRDGKAKWVVTTRFDRLTRSSLHWELALQELQQAGAEVKIIDEANFDINTPDGRLFSRIRAAFAQGEVEELSLRARKGWENLRRLKIAVNPPFGYLKSGGKHVLDTRPFLCKLDGKQELSKSDIAREVVQTFLQAGSLRKTIQQLNVEYGLWRSHHGGRHPGFAAKGLFQWSHTGLSQWLKSPVLRGHLIYLKDTSEPITFYDTHPDQRLISDEEYNQIEFILDYNRKRKGFGARKALNERTRPLSGLIFCAECMSSCFSVCGGPRGGKPRGYSYYQCSSARYKSCSQTKYLRAEDVEEQLINKLCQRAKQISEIAAEETQNSTTPEIEKLKSKLIQLDAIAFDPDIEQTKQKLQDRLEKLLNDLKQQNEDSSTLKMLVAFEDVYYWKTLSDSQKLLIYHSLCRKILVRDRQVVSIDLLI